MYQDPNNPLNPSPAPTEPVAVPPVDPMAMGAPVAPMPEAPAPEPAPAPAPDMPVIDSALLQQAIADVPEEATADAPAAPSAVSLDNLGAVSSPEPGAVPSADFGSSAESSAAEGAADAQKAPPSVAFNDPADAPEASGLAKIDLSSLLNGKKINPVILIVVGSAVVIIGLVLLIAFAV